MKPRRFDKGETVEELMDSVKALSTSPMDDAIVILFKPGEDALSIVSTKMKEERMTYLTMCLLELVQRTITGADSNE